LGNITLYFRHLDKQSGLDHYEIFERGSWQPVTSPHQLQRQSFLDGLQVRAIDKAGNIRMGNYTATSVPELQADADLDAAVYVHRAVYSSDSRKDIHGSQEEKRAWKIAESI